MIYQRVRWLHDDVDRPVQLYGEIDDDGRTVRQVDEFRDGRLACVQGTGLPDLVEIATSPDLVGDLISRAEFEQIWHLAQPAQPPDLT